jgi:ADP-ribosylglycohydrolase
VIPHDYEERVYAGVLGKIIGVYLGRPFEGWSYERIIERLGEVNYYVHERLNTPLIVTDDDISGTFTFFRALDDYGNGRELTARQIGQTWLNYLIENRTILWWGGMGNSTEHTAFLRLKAGIPAPESGSMVTNGKVVAEQIGAQIFIDAWAMACPGDPELAAEFARKAGSVSHDGEAIYGAQSLAAMEALAFVESDRERLLDTAVSLIPKDSIIYRMTADIREWHRADGDWRKTRGRIVGSYGYDKYGGNCHMVPNHALILLGLLYGDDDFQRSMMITNTSGWDTDCNSGNIGCLMGIKLGLAGIDAGPDWRTLVADRLYLAAADGGRGVTDAVRETEAIVRVGCSLAHGSYAPPKNGARYHFELPGSVQGFVADNAPECHGTATVTNAVGHSRDGKRSLAIRYEGVATGRSARVGTATFIPPDAVQMGGYGIIASPTLYSGQTVTARVVADDGNASPVNCGLYLATYGDDNRLVIVRGATRVLNPGEDAALSWQIDSSDGNPVAQVGIEITSTRRANGTVYLDYLTWSGAPDVAFTKPRHGGNLWQRAWVNAADTVYFGGEMPTYRIMQNRDKGLLMTGTREWTDYTLSATVEPHLAASTGVAARVQGLKRYYALLLCRDGNLRLVKELDGTRTLAVAPYALEFDTRYELALRVEGNAIEGVVNGSTRLAVADADCPLTSGGIGLVCEEGRVDFGYVSVRPNA